MAMVGAPHFEQVHIDVARNATDDFNPFHDKTRWHRVAENPFGGPIVLGFQLECFIAHEIALFRKIVGEEAQIRDKGLNYSNYEFRFVSPVTAGSAITVDIRPSRNMKGQRPAMSNRVSLKSDDKLAVTGYKRETAQPLFMPAINLAALGDLNRADDRSFPANSDVFLKRKYMTTSNAKNFLCGSLIEQSEYIDELAEKVLFPEMYPCALLSCALLERAWRQGHDFERQPMIYTSHQISINRTELQRLKSNDSLHLLSQPAASSDDPHSYECVGVVGNDRVLFGAKIDLTPL